MLYMFLLHWDPANPSEDAIEKHMSLTEKLRARHAYVYSEALGDTSAATTVRVRDGKTMITDGPYIESREVMGGFYLLDCKDLDDALDIAAQIPDAESAGVEVRPVMAVPGWDYGEMARYQRQMMG
jgi:hypothetical protein